MKQRILSGIVMAIILIPLVILGGRFFAVACGVIGVLALKEIIDLKEHHKKIPDFMFLISILVLLLLIFSEFDGYGIAFGLTYRGIALTFICLFFPCLFYKNDKYTAHEAIYLSGSILFLGMVFNCFILIRNYDIWHFVYLVLIPILTDIFAMISGKLIGKHKCSPVISPFKTWEGAICGTIVATSISSIFYLNVIGSISIFKILFLTALLSVIGQLGDLVFSKIKRENKIKDYSNIIPGHGGILDRIDSLVFVVIAFVILFGKI